MVRVSGGSLRGRGLLTPPDERVRPTTGRMREMIFSILGSRLIGARVLDLFAGSGVLGIESVSRGAASACFVELDRGVARLLHANLVSCGIEHASTLIEDSVVRPGVDERIQRDLKIRCNVFAPFDLLFMDPPYRQGLVPATLEMLAASTLLAPGAVAVAEHEAGIVGKGVAPAWRPMQNRRHGETQISFWQWSG
ncbi:MAG: 16S rRNA (guanine(966)-N(2))-methyltransferase RsmD [Magnetococcales bacterium]|nr:16S rRNA (guanine(966)-N(2))-methyltransferase RsmD [Magnetococcales bacterium]